VNRSAIDSNVCDRYDDGAALRAARIGPYAG